MRSSNGAIRIGPSSPTRSRRAAAWSRAQVRRYAGTPVRTRASPPRRADAPYAHERRIRGGIRHSCAYSAQDGPPPDAHVRTAPRTDASGTARNASAEAHLGRELAVRRHQFKPRLPRRRARPHCPRHPRSRTGQTGPSLTTTPGCTCHPSRRSPCRTCRPRASPARRFRP